MSQFSFTKRERIQKRSDFRKVYAKGLRRESEHFKILILPNNQKWSRLGLTVGRHAGSAVARNYIKRRLREYFRLHKTYLPNSCDIVLSPKRGANRLAYVDVCAELNTIFRPVRN